MDKTDIELLNLECRLAQYRATPHQRREPMNDTFWEVRVYHEDGIVSAYAFWNIDTLLKSIDMTWKDVPHRVKISKAGNRVNVLANDDANTPLLYAKLKMLDETISSEPKHF